MAIRVRSTEVPDYIQRLEVEDPDETIPVEVIETFERRAAERRERALAER